MKTNFSIQNAGQNIETTPTRHKWGYWWRVLLITFGLYLVGSVILFFTGNPILFPTVAMLGSFMIPVTYVAFFTNGGISAV